jgi:hypothetical protein
MPWNYVAAQSYQAQWSSHQPDEQQTQGSNPARMCDLLGKHNNAVMKIDLIYIICEIYSDIYRDL